ncbi:iron uptake transporter deferrochelatase/peroxidase subunit [Paenibacillus pasadenensis]|uniref:iron uptake transporter deferrochelatase/peroxidase subunit n=1 Tax=Paenibacillus pasadenensis TaxID=217090 RepID=UPI00203F2B9E|nr:iron uptake transporter deferrochelatase/peroxidase subunit [Paenibacillus pasadenensis]MCM3745741.1 iron uptake transporter deferrochelatase/peroxidase subunit [Paenibacillus pasadenensis]
MKSDKGSSRLTRRDFLKLSAVAGAALTLGGGGASAIMSALGRDQSTAAASESDKHPFYGARQSGIVTPQQKYMYLASFRVIAESKGELSAMLKEWTKFSTLAADGGHRQDSGSNLLPPPDTGESVGLGAANLTLTFGFGESFFAADGKDRFGINHRKPLYLQSIPHMPKDHLEPSFQAGDIAVQVCADDQQIAFHSLRNLIRLASGKAIVNWMEEGFISVPDGGQTPRNLFGFKDGTANLLHHSDKGYNDVVWAGQSEPLWMQGGSYLAYRKIRMLLEVWDRTSLKDQEDTFGRTKESGAAYGAAGEFDAVTAARLPADSHVELAKQSRQSIHRRAYSYTGGIDSRTGQLDAGLLFLSYQRNPQEQFIPMLRLMQSKDRLNEYTQHVASALYACPPGIREGQYIGQSLLEA